jgi:hypothetical protein
LKLRLAATAVQNYFYFGKLGEKKIGASFKKFYRRNGEGELFRLQNFLEIFSKQYISGPS